MGKAQAENNGLLDQEGDPGNDVSDPLGATEMKGKDDSLTAATPTSVPSTPKKQKSLDLSLSSAQSTPGHEKSDTEFDTETSSKVSSLSHDDLVRLFQKQEKTLNRYKTRFSEVCQLFLRHFLLEFSSKSL